MRLKRNFLACALLVIALSGLANATLAYFTATATARNVVTAGGIDIVLDETVDDKGTPWTDVENVMPGDVIPKIVTVTNEQEPAWVRVWVEVTAVHPELGEFPAPMEAIVDGSEVSIDFDTENWLYNEEDGHFYYKTALATDESTEPLFTQVSFNAVGMGDAWQNCQLVIEIEAEAVQTANNPESLGWSDCGHEILAPDVIL